MYVLVHPSDPTLCKVGMTTRHPEERLAEHNSRHEEYTGRIVKETGQKWELKAHIAVPDTYWAEAVFWGATGLADIPYRRGIEIANLEWKSVQAGLDAVRKAGVRPPPGPVPDYIFAYNAWMTKRLVGRGISLIGDVRSKTGKSDFRCESDHEWRTVPIQIAEEGKGCPQCGKGERSPEEIRSLVNAGVFCLLVHPDKAGVVKIGVTDRTDMECRAENFWGEWQVQKFQNVEERDLAESLIRELLGDLMLNVREPFNMDLAVVEQAFRDLHYRLVSEIALIEKAKAVSKK